MVTAHSRSPAVLAAARAAGADAAGGRVGPTQCGRAGRAGRTVKVAAGTRYGSLVAGRGGSGSGHRAGALEPPPTLLFVTAGLDPRHFGVATLGGAVAEHRPSVLMAGGSPGVGGLATLTPSGGACGPVVVSTSSMRSSTRVILSAVGHPSAHCGELQSSWWRVVTGCLWVGGVSSMLGRGSRVMQVMHLADVPTCCPTAADTGRPS